MVTIPFRFVFPSVPNIAPFRFNFCSVRYFLPIVSSYSFTSSSHLKAFISLGPSFRSNLLSCSSCSSFPVNSSISLRPSFCCNSSLPFVASFLSLQLFVILFTTSFVSTLPFCSLYVVPSLILPFRSLLPPHRFNASTLFMYLFLSCQCVHVADSFLFLKSDMRFVYLFLFSKSFISLPPSFFNSYIRFVYLFLSFRAVHFVILLFSF